MTEILFIIGALVVTAIWTLLMILIGFRLGRMTAGKPMEAIVAPTPGKIGIEEDPYYEPMNGVAQSKSTMEDK